MPKAVRNGLDVLIGQQLRALRKQHGLTQTELGKLLGVTGQQIHKIETGHNRFYVSQARTVARHFSVSMDYFCPEPQPPRVHAGANTRRPVADAQAVWDLVGTKPGFELVRAFHQLKSERMRKSVVAFVKTMAQKEAAGPAIRRGRGVS